MAFNEESYRKLVSELQKDDVTLIAVSKTKPADVVQSAYDAGHRDFGENYVQELTSKYESLPKDIRWHFIGHLQRNKVKFIAPFVHLIHGVDTLKLAREIDKEGRKAGRVIDGLIQVHIANEDTKHGFLPDEVEDAISQLASYGLTHFKVRGLMGMATFTEDSEQVRDEFRKLSALNKRLRNSEQKIAAHMNILSMGMSGDYKIAVEEGSNMVRIGSLIFGARNYDK